MLLISKSESRAVLRGTSRRINVRVKEVTSASLSYSNNPGSFFVSALTDHLRISSRQTEGQKFSRCGCVELGNPCVIFIFKRI